VLSTPRGRKNKRGKLEGLKLMESDDGENGVPHASPFEAIREEADDGSEYWSARDLAKILGYARWDKFKNAIERAEEACQNSGQAVADHFSQMGKMINLGKGAKQPSLFDEPENTDQTNV
jgi:hypothetical protein